MDTTSSGFDIINIKWLFCSIYSKLNCEFILSSCQTHKIYIYIYIYGRFHSGCTGHLQTFCNLMATKKFTGIIQTAILKLWTTIQIENIICKFIFKYLTCILALNFVPYIIFLKLVLGKSDSSSKSCENIIYMENLIVSGNKPKIFVSKSILYRLVWSKFS